jgi:hypothetical protein
MTKRRNGALPELTFKRSMVRAATKPITSARAMATSARIECVLILSGFVLLFFALSHSLRGDDVARFGELQALLEHGRLTDGPFSLVGPLLSAPVVLLGRIGPSETWWAARFNVLCVAAGSAIVWRTVGDRVSPQLLRRTLLVLLAASFLTSELRNYGTEVVTATLLAAGVFCIWADRAATAGWLALVLGVVNTPAVLGAVVPYVGYQAFRTKRLRPVIWLLVAALLIMGEGWLRRGNPLNTGYGGNHGVPTILPYSGRPDFSYPFVLGVASILFSFGRGLLFFTPGLVLWLDSRTRRATAAIRPILIPMLLTVVGLVLVYAKWWAWYGGVSWGPRFFLFAALPASLLIAACTSYSEPSVARRLLALGVLSLSAWVGVTGATTDYSELAFCASNHYALESLCWYVPDFSSLWWPILHRPALTPGEFAFAMWCAAVYVYLAAHLIRGIPSELGRRLTVRSWMQGWRL